VRSTTHLLGKKALESFGRSYFKSMATPSLAHSLTHILIASSGAIFGRWRTIWAVHPIPLAASLPLAFSSVAGVHPQMGETWKVLRYEIQRNEDDKKLALDGLVGSDRSTS
jgi:hypothetical protein